MLPFFALKNVTEFPDTITNHKNKDDFLRLYYTFQDDFTLSFPLSRFKQIDR